MELSDFTYHRPQSLEAACELGRTFGPEGRYLAGGTELLVDLKNKRDSADHVISLGDVPGLAEIQLEPDGTLRIGAMATLSKVARSEAVRVGFPVLRAAVLRMGSVQIRNQATIGGNFCRAVPCADGPPVCLVAGAMVRLVGAETERLVPAAEFFVAPRRTILHPDELLVEILIPPRPDHFGASYQRFQLRRGMALAVAAVAASVVLQEERIGQARVVLNAVAPVPLPAAACAEAVTGRKPSAELFAEAAEIAAGEARPIDDLRGSAEYRRRLVRVLAARALAAATQRAREDVG